MSGAKTSYTLSNRRMSSLSESIGPDTVNAIFQSELSAFAQHLIGLRAMLGDTFSTGAQWAELGKKNDPIRYSAGRPHTIFATTEAANAQT